MTSGNILCLLCPALALGQTATGQGFVNLNFEQARITPTPVGQYGPMPVDPAQAFPGWTMGHDGTYHGNFTLYNNLTLGSVAQVLVGPSYPNAIHFEPLQGSYSALLQFGPDPELGSPELSQTGLVPATARSIRFLADPSLNHAVVTLNGVNIPLFDMGGNWLAGDVSAFAGRQAELKFSTPSYHGGWLYFDDVRFSPLVVPEPATLVLTSLGGSALVAAARRRSTPRPAARQHDQASPGRRPMHR